MKMIFRIEIKGMENIPKDGGCMICANHISMWDPVLLWGFLPRNISFMAKEELVKVPLVGLLLKAVGTVFVKRGSGDIGAIKACLGALSSGKAIGIFPTGTREKINPGSKPKSGAALIALKAGTSVVPVSIKADYRIFSKVQVVISNPMDFSEYKGKKSSSEELAIITDKIYDKILEFSS
jgi:1-acyl-sn-glycerol-3-phosphate acyltransferase